MQIPLLLRTPFGRNSLLRILSLNGVLSERIQRRFDEIGESNHNVA